MLKISAKQWAEYFKNHWQYPTFSDPVCSENQQKILHPPFDFTDFKYGTVQVITPLKNDEQSNLDAKAVLFTSKKVVVNNPLPKNPDDSTPKVVVLNDKPEVQLMQNTKQEEVGTNSYVKEQVLKRLKFAWYCVHWGSLLLAATGVLLFFGALGGVFHAAYDNLMFDVAGWYEVLVSGIVLFVFTWAWIIAWLCLITSYNRQVKSFTFKNTMHQFFNHGFTYWWIADMYVQSIYAINYLNDYKKHENALEIASMLDNEYSHLVFNNPASYLALTVDLYDNNTALTNENPDFN